MNPFFENAPGGGKSEEEIKNLLFLKFLEYQNQIEPQKNDKIVNELKKFDFFGGSQPQKKQENPKNVQKEKSEYEPPNKNTNKAEIPKPPDYKEMTLDELIKSLKEKDEKITNLEVQIIVLQAEKKEFQEKSDELQSRMMFLPEAGMFMCGHVDQKTKELSECRKKCDDLESEIKQYKEKSEQEIQRMQEKLTLENEEKNKMKEKFQKIEETKTENSKECVLSKNLEINISGEQEGEFQNDRKNVGNLTNRNSLSSKLKILLNIINISQKKRFSI